MGSERRLIWYPSLEGGCCYLELITGDEEHDRLKDNCIVGKKIRKLSSFLLVKQETEIALEEGGAHEHVLLTVNSRKLMLIYSSYTPCNLLEK